MKRIGLTILMGGAAVVILAYCLVIDFLALFSKRATQYKLEQEIVVEYPNVGRWFRENLRAITDLLGQCLIAWAKAGAVFWLYWAYGFWGCAAITATSVICFVRVRSWYVTNFVPEEASG